MTAGRTERIFHGTLIIAVVAIIFGLAFLVRNNLRDIPKVIGRAES